MYEFIKQTQKIVLASFYSLNMKSFAHEMLK